MQDGEQVMDDGKGSGDFLIINYYAFVIGIIPYLVNWGKSLKTLNWDPRPATSLATYFANSSSSLSSVVQQTE